jgi:hypothetical protein
MLAVLLTLHVLPEHALNVRLEHALDVRLVRVAAPLAVTVLYQVLLAMVAPMQQVLQEQQVDTIHKMYWVKDLSTIVIADVKIPCIMVVYT